MKQLNTTWITEGTIDFEYKKYVLLSYLQEVKASFKTGKLYPFFSELIDHYKNLIHLKERKELIVQRFKKEVDDIDLNQMRVVYRRIVEDDEIMREIQSIIEFALPLVKGEIKQGAKIYELVENHMRCKEIGIQPLQPTAGYIFLHRHKTREINVYSYSASLVRYPEDNYRMLETEFVMNKRKGFTDSYADFKLELLREYKEIPNPSIYLIEYDLALPINETILPIAKRMLLRKVS